MSSAFTIGLLFLLLQLSASGYSLNVEEATLHHYGLNGEYSVNETIAALYQSILSDQYTDSVNPGILPPFFGHQAGRYKNGIHLNFVGNSTMQAMRNLGIPDNNMFVTQFVGEGLLEAGLLLPGYAPINDTVIYNGLLSSLRNHDKRFPSDVPIFGFWEQEWKTSKIGGDKKAWRQWSINMSPFLNDLEKFGDVMKFLLEDILHDKSAYDKYVEPIAWLGDTFYRGFNIPPDADDTSTMAAFSRWLSNSALLPQSSTLWQAQGYNLSLAYDEVIRTAYCPASNNSDMRNATDTRSYYWMRSFIQNITHPDDCLVATWIESYPEMVEAYEGIQPGPINPLNANNVDASVAANTLYGMSVSLLEGSSEWFTRPDERGKRLYMTTARLVADTLTNQANIERPDLELLYYPAVMNFLYFVARHLKLLESTPDENIPFPEMIEVRSILRQAAESGGLSYLYISANFPCDVMGRACWDGFLGEDDTNNAGQPTPHHDDRLYTTAVAVNTLIDFYTTSADNGTSIQWRNTGGLNTVRNLTAGGLNYILHEANDVNASLANTFFSGSVKTVNGFPYPIHPTWVRNMETGEIYNCSNATQLNFKYVVEQAPSLFWVVRGLVPEEEYHKMLDTPCGSLIPWTNWEGYNNPKQQWPFWSAPVLTRVYAMLALVKGQALGLI